MASCRRCGAIPADGRNRSSAASTRAWTFAIQAVNSLVVVGTGEVFQRIFFEHFHFLLGPGEDSLAVLSELQAPLVRGKGLLQGHLPRLHAGNDSLQFGEGRFEAFGLIGLGGFCAHGEAAREPARAPFHPERAKIAHRTRQGQIDLRRPAGVPIGKIPGTPARKGLESRPFYFPVGLSPVCPICPVREDSSPTRRSFRFPGTSTRGSSSWSGGCSSRTAPATSGT